MNSPTPSSSSSTVTAPEHVLVLYASETGNAQDVAERVGREFRRYGRKAVVLSMELFDILELPYIPLLILITSTHGRGDPPPAMLPLWTALLRTSLPEDILEDVHFTVFGLGDTSYERYCYAGKMLARRMEGLGAQKIGEPAWGDERAPDGIEETLLPWLQQTLDLMLPYLPPTLSLFEAHPTTSLPLPIYSLEPVDEPPLESLAISSSSEPVNNGECSYKPDDWVWARSTKNTRVTREDWWQDVREVEFEFESADIPPYLPGSIASLQPSLSTEEVNTFLDLMGLRETADTAVVIRPLPPDQPIPSHLPPVPTTLRSLLTNHLDLRAPPRKSFFEWMRRLSPDEREQERLNEFIADPDEIHTYATRPSRSILETLADFRQTKIPLSHILEILPPLRRRQFSIASSSSAHAGKVQLLIALVEYKTILKIPRRGLCSSWLDDLPLGGRVPIKISAPTLFLPKNPATPVILVGPGTGVAPMRAFIEERVRQGAAKQTMLYFGCRSISADYYYSSEWEQYRKLGVRIRVAASRDQEEKVYVQDLMREDKELVRDWVVGQHGSLFISGSSNAMPKEVRGALADCLVCDQRDREAAEAYVEEMFESGRGGEESW